MLRARRKSDGQIVTAYFTSKADAPFVCPDCREAVTLRTGKSRVSHFAHVNPIACKFATGETDAHRRCKFEIFEALRKHPDVRDVALELPFADARADIYARIRGVPVAIEVQISSLPLDTILRRTIQYGQKGIHVLWLLQWTPKLDAPRYTPRLWEKWVHAAYFGQVYYWVEGLTVISYHFESHFKTVPKRSWHSAGGDKVTAGGYSRRSKRYRSAVRGQTLNLATDFVPRKRYWWEGNGLKVPDATLYMHHTADSTRPVEH